MCVQTGHHFMAWSTHGYECWQEVLESILCGDRGMLVYPHWCKSPMFRKSMYQWEYGNSLESTNKAQLVDDTTEG